MKFRRILTTINPAYVTSRNSRLSIINEFLGAHDGQHCRYLSENLRLIISRKQLAEAENRLIELVIN